ncbi:MULTISPECIES: SRPBCC family protein [Aquimarina]|uniref:SRPBCC family protein n=1 Tax=Aquimarina TaxID=290174 RepID=UPI000941CF19|nr:MULTISPECIES: SRPBCC family protein [Aquimarina]
MKILKKTGLGILLLILLISVVSLFFSTQKEVSRSTVIHAPVEHVFNHVNAMENWKKWGGPWQEEGMDYAKVIQKTLGATVGVGSKLIYNQGKGDGSVEIIESDLNKRIKTLITFEDGGFANGTWLFNEDHNTTTVTWTVKVNLGYNPLKRIMGNLMMEHKIGSVFEKGLVNLKKVSE